MYIGDVHVSLSHNANEFFKTDHDLDHDPFAAKI